MKWEMAKAAILLLLCIVYNSCVKTEQQVFGEIKIEQLPLQNPDVFVFRSVDSSRKFTTEFGTGEPISFMFELSNNTIDTVFWTNYEELANNVNDFIKVYNSGKVVGTPYKMIEPVSHKKWMFLPESMVRFTMTWINNDRAQNDYVDISSSQPMNNFLEKGDYCAKIKFPLVYIKGNRTDTIECNKTIYFSVISKK